MKKRVEQMAERTKGIDPFNSRQLSQDEERLFYTNPIAFFSDQPWVMTNAQASQVLLNGDQEHGLAGMGAVKYVAWVERMHTSPVQQEGPDGAAIPD